MKMKLFSIILKTLLLNLVTVLATKTYPAQIAKFQNLTSPDLNEAPTSPNEIGKIINTGPKLSESLNESDPNKKLKRAEFLERINFSHYKLSRGEAEQVFFFADANRDDLIDAKEWATFLTLFILPFEACNAKADYLLDAKELKKCFEADPRSNYVAFRRRYDLKDTKYELIKQILSSRAGNSINFSEYLFLRKALFGWKECHSNSKFIAKYHFKCAIAAALPHKIYNGLETNLIYESGLRLFGDRALIELDFIAYLGILHYTNIFGIMNQPVHSSLLEKSQWIKAIREDRFANNFEEVEVEQIYELIGGTPYAKARKVTSIDFQSFVWFFHLHRLFNMYSSTRPLQINALEFKRMLNDPFIMKEIVHSIDNSFTKFTEQQYQEASVVIQRLKPNERNFYYSFKQDASRFSNFSFNNSTINTDYFNTTINETNREVFFTMMTDVDKEYVNKTNLYRAFQTANFWVAISGYPEASLPSSIFLSTIIKQSPLLYDTVKPPISMNQRTNAVLYKSIPNELKIDLLNYMALENFFFKTKIPYNSSRNVLTEKDLKIILKDYGMENMPDTVLDYAMKGFDSLRRREYIPQEVIKHIVIVNAVASELARDQTQITKMKLKLVKNSLRGFPARRL